MQNQSSIYKLKEQLELSKVAAVREDKLLVDKEIKLNQTQSDLKFIKMLMKVKKLTWMKTPQF